MIWRVLGIVGLGLLIGWGVPTALCRGCAGAGGVAGAWDQTGVEKPLGPDMAAIANAWSRPPFIILPFTSAMIDSWSMYKDVGARPLQVQLVQPEQWRP